METGLNSTSNIENVSMSEILELASWDRPRTNEQLLGFIARREAEISDYDF